MEEGAADRPRINISKPPKRRRKTWVSRWFSIVDYENRESQYHTPRDKTREAEGKQYDRDVEVSYGQGGYINKQVGGVRRWIIDTG